MLIINFRPSIALHYLDEGKPSLPRPTVPLLRQAKCARFRSCSITRWQCERERNIVAPEALAHYPQFEL